jgi:hypothetical protein
MPRPTTAQVAYGSLTVVLSTLAMLLLSDAHSGAAVVALAAAGLVLGVLVAAALSPSPQSRRTAGPAAGPVAPPAPSRSLPRARMGRAAEARVSEHSVGG